MKNRIPCLFLSMAAVAAALSAANHNVQVGPSNSFSPSSLTIDAGDTVTWSNAGGLHNVEANNGSFRCANGCDGQGGDGNPSTNAWSFSLTFNTPEVIDYFCEIHVGVGMTGRITVMAGGVSEPGNLSFNSASSSVGEGAGSATISVRRSGGTDGTVGVSFAATAGSASAGMDFLATSGNLSWSDGQGGSKTFTVTVLDDNQNESNETINLTLSNATGGAALVAPNSATLTIIDDDAGTSEPGSIQFMQDDFSGVEAGGEITVGATRSGGSDGAVSVSYDVLDGSAVAGEDFEPNSGVLSWGDGRNGPRTFDVNLLDDSNSESTETANLTLSNATGGAALGSPASATLTILDDDVDTSPCVADEQTACLAGGRFRVQVDWTDATGRTGVGQLAALGLDEGEVFYFFNANNPEMLVKVKDACVAPFDRFWVFLAATTNVEFTVRITDTEAGQIKEYHNPQGQAAVPVQDIDAFATCQ